MPATRRALIATGLAAAAAPALAEPAEFPWRLPPLRKIEAADQSIAYYEQGAGPALVLVHGMSGSAAFEWGRVIPALARRFRVIAPYQIGFAPSAQPDITYDAAAFVDSLGAFLTAVGVRRASLVGESFGGWVVAQYARAEAARRGTAHGLPRLDKLVIVDGAVGITPADRKSPEPPGINDPAVSAEIRAFFASHPMADTRAIRAKVVPHIQQEMIRPDQLPGRRLPTLVVWGDGDQIFPLPVGQRIAQGVPGAKLAVIKDCDHIPSVERPAAFVRALEGFL